MAQKKKLSKEEEERERILERWNRYAIHYFDDIEEFHKEYRANPAVFDTINSVLIEFPKYKKWPLDQQTRHIEMIDQMTQRYAETGSCAPFNSAFGLIAEEIENSYKIFRKLEKDKAAERDKRK